MRRTVGSLVTVVLAGLWVPAALAVGYASGVTTSGDDVTFTLNQASNVTIVFDGGAGALPLGALGTGAHTFSKAGYGNFCIEVRSNSGADWAQISTDGTNTSFYSPKGVMINKNPWSSNFGKVYVGNAVAGTTAAYGRLTDDGIFMLDGALNDLGFGTAGVPWSTGDGSGASPWKGMIGADDNLYVTRFSHDELYEVTPDVSANTLLVGAANRLAGQYVAGAWVEGTQAGGDRTLYVVDSAYPSRGIVRYTLGSDATATGTGDEFVAATAFNVYPYDIARDGDGDWYTMQYRYYLGQEPVLRKFDGAGTVPIGDEAAEVLWESTDQYSGSDAMDMHDVLDMIAVGYRAGDSGHAGKIHFFDPQTGALLFELDSGMGNVRDVAFDAAGNLYAVDNVSELLRVYSPGGDWLAITCSDGTFSLIPEPASLLLVLVGGLMIRRR